MKVRKGSRKRDSPRLGSRTGPKRTAALRVSRDHKALRVPKASKDHKVLRGRRARAVPERRGSNRVLGKEARGAMDEVDRVDEMDRVDSRMESKADHLAKDRAQAPLRRKERDRAALEAARGRDRARRRGMLGCGCSKRSRRLCGSRLRN